jgi:hypothetical protein
VTRENVINQEETNMGQIIKMELNGKEYTVKLNDNKIAEEFAQLLPFATSVSEYKMSHYWGYIPKRLSTPKEIKTSIPLKGSVYYADHLTAIAVYYDDPGSIAPYVIYHLGDVVEDMFELKNADYQIRLKVSE